MRKWIKPLFDLGLFLIWGGFFVCVDEYFQLTGMFAVALGLAFISVESRQRPGIAAVDSTLSGISSERVFERVSPATTL